MSSNSTPYYFVPGQSRHPAMAAIGLIAFGFGMSGWVNQASWGGPVTLVGVLWILFVLYKWFGDTIAESNSGKNGVNVDISYRWSMAWFIFSEIMFGLLFCLVLCPEHCHALDGRCRKQIIVAQLLSSLAK